MSYHHGLAGFDPAPFDTMRPGEWTGQGVDPSLAVDPSQWNPTLSVDPVHIAAVNQMLASGINPVTGRPSQLNAAVLQKGFTWHGGTINPFTGEPGRPGDFSDSGRFMGNAFDLGVAGVLALPNASRGAIAFAEESVEAQPAPVYTGPPSGWHAGELDGKAGYWAPDGLFYAGNAPWETYTPGSGTSIHTAKVATPAPMSPTGTPTNATGGGSADVVTSLPGEAVPEHPEHVVFPFDTIPMEYGDPDTSGDATLPGGGAPLAPRTAGLSGTTALLIGAGLLGALFMMKGKR